MKFGKFSVVGVSGLEDNFRTFELRFEEKDFNILEIRVSNDGRALLNVDTQHRFQDADANDFFATVAYIEIRIKEELDIASRALR